jgi:metal-responsive CopG/Arc/MetJ family transcriptional regulator
MGRKLGVNKLKVGFSIDIETYKEFERYCDEKSINKSKLMDRILKNFLENEQSKKEIKNNYI